MSLTEARSSSVTRAPRPSSLADVLDLILDKGLVIDAYVRVSLAGIEVLTIDARIVVASVDTYLRFAEAVNRLDLTTTETPGLKGLSRNSSGDSGDEQSDGAGKRAQSALRRSGDNSDGDGRRSGSTGRGGSGRERAAGASTDREDASEEHEGGEESGGMLHRLAERARFEQ